MYVSGKTINRYVSGITIIILSVPDDGYSERT
jgi:hypothetical protein